MHLGKFDEKRYPSRKCPYGFTCKNHPWGKNKITKDCKYYDDCKKIVRDIAKSSIDIDSYKEYINKIAEESQQYSALALKDNSAHCYRGTNEQTSLFFEAIKKHECSVISLREYANHQSSKSLEIIKYISEVKELLEQLESQLETFDRGYIAPVGAEFNTYNTKRRPNIEFSAENDSQTEYYKPKVYKYCMLRAKTDLFKSKGKAKLKCKSIHLGEIGSEKDIQARLGIEKRNRLLKIRTRLIRAVEAMKEAAKLADVDFNCDDFVKQTKNDS